MRRSSLIDRYCTTSPGRADRAFAGRLVTRYQRLIPAGHDTLEPHFDAGGEPAGPGNGRDIFRTRGTGDGGLAVGGIEQVGDRGEASGRAGPLADLRVGQQGRKGVVWGEGV